MDKWHRRIAELAHRAESHIDRARARIAATAVDGTARIDAYRGYGTTNRALVTGRVLRGAPLPPADASHSVWVNLTSMMQRFESDEIPGALVRVRYPGGETELRSDEEGYFEGWIEPRPGFAPDRLWHQVELELVRPRDSASAVNATAHIAVPPPERTLGVISDIDDTVLRTDATSVLRMVRTTFLGNARTRVAFAGVAPFYRALQRGLAQTPVNPIFYVSSSPWNFYDLLSEFLDVQEIPAGPMMLRDWGVSRSEILPTGHGKHKHAAIRRILDTYPTLPFILIGDSGQEDPEIYHRIVHDYPRRILAVYIRNVHPLPARAEAVRALAEEVTRAGSDLLLTDDTCDAALHAVKRGWISADALEEIRAVAAEEGEPVPIGTAEANDALSTVPKP